MNVLKKVTLKSLKNNRTRTTVTIIGIILSAALICAVTTFISSIQNYLLSYMIYNIGDWHGAAYGTNYETCEEITSSDKLSNSAYGQLLGYSETESSDKQKPYMYVIGGEQDSFFDTMPVHLVEGSYPQNTNEIIIPEHILSENNSNYKIGNAITLSLGDRIQNGISLGQNIPYSYDSEENENDEAKEYIEVRETRTFTIVGIYEYPDFERADAPGYTALTVADSRFDSSDRFDVYFKMNDPSDTFDFIKTIDPDTECDTNDDVLAFSGAFKYDSFFIVLRNLAIIVIGLIMLGSISLIYNAFSISVSERTKQFGLLSSIGATKRQLRNMVFFEALSVSAIGIPLGIGVGIAGIAVTLKLMSNKFSAIFNFDMPIHICVSWESIVIAVVISLVTVLISAWIPSIRATRVSAVEAIRQNMDIKIKNKPVKTSKLTYRLFGLPGVLANKHYKRNKKKYRTTVISLFMSIVLFISAASFTSYLTDSLESGFYTENYDLSFSFSENEDDTEKINYDEMLKLLKSDKDVTGGAYTYSNFFQLEIPKEYLTDEFIEYNKQNGDEKNTDNNTENVIGCIDFVNDEEFEALLKKYSLDKDDYFNAQKPLGLAIDNHNVFDYNEKKFMSVDTLKGDTSKITLTIPKKYDGYSYIEQTTDENGNEVVLYENENDSGDTLVVPYDDTLIQSTLETGKTITDYPFYITNSTTVYLNIIYPYSMLDYIIPRGLQENLNNNFYLTSDNHSASCENLKKLLQQKGIESFHSHDYAQNVEINRNLISIIKVFSYGFIILISLIATANVFNTISTNISLRRREFAMLKSVGMTKKGFNKMMNFECLLYGSKALILGLPVSAFITYLIYKSVSEGFAAIYHLPWHAVGIAVLSVFIVVFATMMYSMNKIKKDNPIDALKNENL